MNLPAHRADLTPVSLADDGRVVGFAYETLPADDARELQTVTTRMRERMQADAIENGRDLLAVKDRLAGTVGAFGAWLHAEFRMSERTAQNYMAAAREFGDHPAVVAVLPPGTVYALAAPSTPETIRQDVIRRVEEGERPEPAAIRETITAAKRAKQQAQEAERKAAQLAKLTPEQRADLERKAKRSRRSREQREAEEARQRAERKATREQGDRKADIVAEAIAAALGEDLNAMLASCDDWTVWSKVWDKLKAISAQPPAPATAAQLDAAA